MRPVQGPGVSWWPVRAVLTPVMQVAGLGNYGLRGTRHSVGMEVLDQLARQLAVAEGWRVDKRCCADVALATAHGLELVLLKPRRFMNLNGLSVASAAELYSLGPGDIYLVHDDLDKALGKVAIKLGGSASTLPPLCLPSTRHLTWESFQCSMGQGTQRGPILHQCSAVQRDDPAQDRHRAARG
ncbi:probable peptidyl-tRNA hydrolase isoform X6 [Motacilla alba alba]|uniref:probable peptidyl-tRNA hydrolase isoform X6 n=1 Tax=Motacilla alba alba TaxID=1094192 RepID=UPI0018D4FF99|nr:probable peptidyl-tRNA hydrolase isoform X6 [Motacilla alba alba]